MKKGDFIAAIAFLALSIFAYGEARNMVGKLATDGLGPSFWPKVVSGIMLVLSLIMMFQSLFSKKSAEQKDTGILNRKVLSALLKFARL